MEAQTQPREVALYRSVTRPVTLLGGDRELVIVSVVFALTLAMSFANLFGALLGGGVWIATLAGLRAIAKADPLMRKVYLAHLNYAPFYSAHARPRAEGATTPWSW
jgi:type IV secretory pathway TrbD component